MKGLGNYIRMRLISGAFTKMIYFLMCLGMVILQSCRQEEVSENNIKVENSHEIDGENRFELTISLKAMEPDVMEFFYVLDSLDGKFSEERKIRKKINGGNILETIQFDLENQKPLKFMIVFGRNKKQKTLEIDNIEIRYKTKKLIIEGHLSKHFFNGNKYMKFAEVGNTLTFERKDNVLPPYMTSSALLYKKMKIEFR